MERRFKGVTYCAKLGKWRGQIVHKKRAFHLGYFERDEDAAKAYDKAARKYKGYNAVLNFPYEGIVVDIEAGWTMPILPAGRV